MVKVKQKKSFQTSKQIKTHNQNNKNTIKKINKKLTIPQLFYAYNRFHDQYM